MIPLRVTVDGFLSYRKSETFDFSERPLWMLSGDNGAGKSSIFDAITYVLFKKHRGGIQNAADLINWHRDEFKVMFEFQMGREQYRAERSEGKHGGTRKISHWDGTHWEPLPESTSDTGFKSHVDKILHMNYHTFTSCALLCQGKVDRLLEVEPKDRFTLLSQIVDLSRYHALYKKADDRQKQYSWAATEDNGRLQYMPSVTQAEISDAETEASRAKQNEVNAHDHHTDLIALVGYADRWEKLNAKVKELQSKIAEAALLISDDNLVRERAARHHDLSANLPLLRDLRDSRHQLEGTEAEYTQAQAEVLAAISNWETNHASADSGLTLEQKTRWLTQQLQSEIVHLEDAQSALPCLQNLAKYRRQAREAVEQINILQQDIQNAPVVPPTEEIACVTEKGIHASAEAEYTAASERLIDAQKESKSIALQLDRLQAATKSDGEKQASVCHYCGQPLSEERCLEMKAELVRQKEDCDRIAAESLMVRNQRNADVKAAAQSLREAQQAWHMARNSEADREKELNRQEQLFHTAVREAVDEAWQIPAGIYSKQAQSIFPDQYPNYASDAVWLTDTTSFPTAVELAQIRSIAEQLPSMRQKEKSFQYAQNRVQICVGKLSDRQAEETKARQRLPSVWQSWYDAAPSTPNPIKALESEMADLHDSTSRLTALQEAVRDHQLWKQTLQDAMSEIDDLPTASHRPKIEIEQMVKTAKSDWDTARRGYDTVLKAVENLQKQKLEREEVERSLAANRRKEEIYKTLAGLLGPENLQRSLLRGAEESITIYANEALHGFSHGTLRLEARKEGSGRGGQDKALDLLCINTDSAGDDAPLPLSNLSGSQKFRVAVALALGIGRFARNNDARIESVIIDEGFGSLDRQNQQDMADAICSLADGQRLKRIIVVSHQEAFADRFPDRIHVALGPEGSYKAEVPISL